MHSIRDRGVKTLHNQDVSAQRSGVPMLEGSGGLRRHQFIGGRRTTRDS